MDNSLTNFMRYCLGYIKLTRERTVLAQQKYSVILPSKYFGLLGLLSAESDLKRGELVNLDTFYKYDPKDVPEDEAEEYEKEKGLANKIEDIYNKSRNDQYTKQVVLNFGYFEIEIPIVENGDVLASEEEENEAEKEIKTKIDRYPLFALPVMIEKKIRKSGVGEYFIYSVDPEVQVNIGMLEPILGEDLYFQILEEMGKYEVNGQFTLPMADLGFFADVWHQIKAQLRLKNANFDETSFSLEEIRIALSPKANYFLAEDLAKLTKLTEEELSNTALTSWVKDGELNVESDVPHEKDLYFPFLYDKYQLSTLSLLGNKASIIQGPPGTGKSETISNILCHLAATGNRVLFVSQKAQALKVVKDKLKKLNVKYLFGYLPNPSSAQIGDEDEADGIAPQLSALGAHIEKLSYNIHPMIRTGERCKEAAPDFGIEQIVDEKDEKRNALEKSISEQRQYYKFHQELLKLEEYDLDVSSLENFSKSCTFTEWQVILSTKAEIESLNKVIYEYQHNEEKMRFDSVFSSINLNKERLADAIREIKDDVSKTGYDRHSRFFRTIVNAKRNFRMGKFRGQLPREIVDYVDGVLAADLSRSEQIKPLSGLHAYCAYYENLQQVSITEDKLRQKFVFCGISDKEFEEINKKITSLVQDEFEKVKGNILRVHELKRELNKLAEAGNLNQIGATLKHAEQERAKRVAGYIQNIVNQGISEKWKTGITIKQIVRKLASAFGKSKKAFKTFDNLRKDVNNFNAILDLIPVWIMELDDASRIIPLEAGIFDYVILDEASQCNVAYTLPVMYRTNRVLFVGDSEQMRDSTIMFKSNRVFDELARRYQIPEERQIKATGSTVQSVLDIAYKRGFMDRPLRYHYRSPAELIGFSNKYFYIPKGKELIPINSNYLTYKDTNRVLVVHEIKSDWGEEISDKINVAEAKEILNLFKELRADIRYQGKSIGILAFFNAQAAFIRDLFEKEGFKEEEHNYKVSIIEGIQGDEKDIVIYSFVIRTQDQKNKYVPLTGEGGDIRADINKGRVNVAFSRARLQIHCFVSLPLDEVPEKIWLKKYLEYAQKNGEVAFNSTVLKPFDSNFEKEFYSLLCASLRQGI